jgi:sulfur-carrier protein adenylyltransferase/sulfurtransferase
LSLGYMLPEQLRHYMRTHHENEYLLVDVRQPEEYRQGHIPGARLLPLPDLVQSMNRLPADKTLVFYCHNGARSMVAAAMMDEEGFDQALYNLSGGVVAWEGGQVADEPRIELFLGKTVAQMFETAMNLEKGAGRFYKRAAREQGAAAWARLFARLAEAEREHAETVYGFWRRNEPQPDDFESVYERLSGEILEGGMPLQSAMDKLAGSDNCTRIIELALQIEYAAYDLYRSMADQTEDASVRQAFMRLAQAEKTHMQRLIKSLAACPESIEQGS